MCREKPSHAGDDALVNIKLASKEDAATVSAITDAAYSKYIPLLGRKPEPMTVDYGEMIAKHPVHFNVTSPTGDASGQDVWKEKRVTDILGVSMHTAWAVPPSTPESGEVLGLDVTWWVAAEELIEGGKLLCQLSLWLVDCLHLEPLSERGRVRQLTVL